ncbi:restriction endonuclease [Streptomyces hygroscopicus]|uniref:restriction endonuclease n=1 Tax=Streptomyces hygroscopicus TaxID=1912 RepID=UPI001FCB511B|nr:restriction endonuclease [Streptomyces hygroscopicus]BDH15702.1 restriction endonuclease [Streptomyces hygroscopicus]
MVTPIRRSGPPPTRKAFSLRKLSASFGVVVIGVVGVGLTLKKAVEGASAHPGSSVIVGVVVLAAVVAFLRWGPRRRAARTALDGPAAVAPETRAVESPPEPDAGTGHFGVMDAGDFDVMDAGDFAAMDADAFEDAVARLCERDGCHDVRVVGGANDLGADVVAVAPDGRTVVLQCKRYGGTNKVGSQELQRFGGTCFAVHAADVAAVITTSDFTDPAVEYADRCGILCFGHPALSNWAAGTGPAPWEQ